MNHVSWIMTHDAWPWNSSLLGNLLQKKPWCNQSKGKTHCCTYNSWYNKITNWLLVIRTVTVMLVTSLCWWLYDGDWFEMLVAESLCWWLFPLCWWFSQSESVTNISNLSPTYWVSNIRHQHRCNQSKPYGPLSKLPIFKSPDFSRSTAFGQWSPGYGSLKANTANFSIKYTKLFSRFYLFLFTCDLGVNFNFANLPHHRACRICKYLLFTFSKHKTPGMVLFDLLTPKDEVIIRSPWVRPWDRNNSGKFGPIGYRD